MMCKKLIYLMSFVLLFSVVGDVQAKDVTWTDAGPDDHLWSTPENWDGGKVPTSRDDVHINMLPGPTIANEGPVATSMLIGGWDGNKVGALTVDGGTLGTTNYITIGAGGGNEGTLNMINGTITTDYEQKTDDGNFEIGEMGSGTLNMTGGTIVIRGHLAVGMGSTSTAYVNLDGGTITAYTFWMRDEEGAVGTMDVGGGTLIIDGDVSSTVQGYIDNGWITAYGGSGWLLLDYNTTNPGQTTLTAYGYALNMVPANGSSVPLSLNQLQWTLPEPNRPGDVVTCDVYFGTNPSIWDNPYIVDEEAVESVSVGPLAINTTYYWAIVLYDPSIPGIDPPEAYYYFSPTFTFTVENQPPDVNAGPDVDTWLVDELPIPPDANRVVQLDGIVTDDGLLEPYTVHWTVVSEPNSVTYPAELSDPNIVNPTITMTALPGLYELELAAYDGELTSSDTIAIQLYDTSCEHAWNQPGFVQLAGDVNHDCKVDFVDIANLAASWLQENYSTE